MTRGSRTAPQRMCWSACLPTRLAVVLPFLQGSFWRCFTGGHADGETSARLLALPWQRLELLSRLSRLIEKVHATGRDRITTVISNLSMSALSRRDAVGLIRQLCQVPGSGSRQAVPVTSL